MPISRIEIDGYRSIRRLRLRLGPVNVFIGANGCGKSNLYRAMLLLASLADGSFPRHVAAEGGMPSILWAGPRRKGPVRLRFKVVFDDASYESVIGLPPKDPGRPPPPFELQPSLKSESLRLEIDGSIECLHRDRASFWARDEQGARTTYTHDVTESDSALSELRDPRKFPEVAVIRQRLLGWRFYHEFRVDPGSPIRQPQYGVRTPVLAHDGHDLAPALATIQEIGDGPQLAVAVDAAFPGATLEIDSGGAHCQLAMQLPEFQRSFSALELSDGTLRYLCLLAALLSPRPPELLALNEPENSLHPSLIEPLARAIVHAAGESQIWLATHSGELARRVAELAGVRPVQLEKIAGETLIARESDGDSEGETEADREEDEDHDANDEESGGED